MYIVARSPDVWVSPARPAPCRLSDPHLTNDRSKVPYRSFVEAKMASSDRATEDGPKKQNKKLCLFRWPHRHMLVSQKDTFLSSKQSCARVDVIQ